MAGITRWLRRLLGFGEEDGARALILARGDRAADQLALVVSESSAPLATILAYLPELTVSDLRELAAPGIVPESLRKYLQAEVQRRLRASEKTASGSAPGKGPTASNRE